MKTILLTLALLCALLLVGCASGPTLPAPIPVGLEKAKQSP